MAHAFPHGIFIITLFFLIFIIIIIFIINDGCDDDDDDGERGRAFRAAVAVRAVRTSTSRRRAGVFIGLSHLARAAHASTAIPIHLVAAAPRDVVEIEWNECVGREDADDAVVESYHVRLAEEAEDEENRGERPFPHVLCRIFELD